MKSSYNLLCFGVGDSFGCSIVTVIKINKDKWGRHHKTDACVSTCCKSIYRCLLSMLPRPLLRTNHGNFSVDFTVIVGEHSETTQWEETTMLKRLAIPVLALV